MASTVLSDAELHQQTGRLVNTPYFIDDAVKRYRSEGESGLSWSYFQCMTQAQRVQMDYWLVGLKHALSFQPGTNEQRFRAIVLQRDKEML